MAVLNGRWLRKARRAKKLTLGQVAKIIGKNRSTIWRYENQQVAVSVNVLLELAELYDVKVEELIMEGNYGI